MNKYWKRFSTSQKLEIFNYYKQHGAAGTSRRYDGATTSIFKWRDILEK